SHYAQARRLFEQACEGRFRLLLPALVVAEVVFVLQDFYRVHRAEILELLQDLIASPNVVLHESQTVISAVQVFGAHHVDFVDAYLAALAQVTKTATLASFKARLSAIPMVEADSLTIRGSPTAVFSRQQSSGEGARVVR